MYMEERVQALLDEVQGYWWDMTPSDREKVVRLTGVPSSIDGMDLAEVDSASVVYETLLKRKGSGKALLFLYNIRILSRDEDSGFTPYGDETEEDKW